MWCVLRQVMAQTPDKSASATARPTAVAAPGPMKAEAMAEPIAVAMRTYLGRLAGKGLTGSVIEGVAAWVMEKVNDR